MRHDIAQQLGEQGQVEALTLHALLGEHLRQDRITGDRQRLAFGVAELFLC